MDIWARPPCNNGRKVHPAMASGAVTQGKAVQAATRPRKSASQMGRIDP